VCTSAYWLKIALVYFTLQVCQNIVYGISSVKWVTGGNIIMISLHILDRIMICLPASQLCFLKVSCFILIHHTPQLSRKQNKESEVIYHTLWFCTGGDSHCILPFTHIISCSQNIISSHIFSSDSHYAQLCFPCTIALFQYEQFTKFKANRNISMVITFEEIS
jgi:hypothetical protein